MHGRCLSRSWDKYYDNASTCHHSACHTLTTDQLQYDPADFVKGIHVRFTPEGEALDNLTSRVFKERCSLTWGNLVEITGEKASASGRTEVPVYKLTPISNPVVAPEP